MGGVLVVINTTYAVEGLGEAKPPQEFSFYAMEGFGEAKAPQDSIFLVRFGGEAAKSHQKRICFGGLAALQTSRSSKARAEGLWRACSPPNLALAQNHNC